MKTVILDSNELMRDWRCAGLKYQLIDHMFDTTWIDVYVPAIVLEEVVENYNRELSRLRLSEDKLTRERRLLGIVSEVSPPSDFDLRSYLAERFDSRLSFTILPWPDISHREVAMRAVRRRPPFDQRGRGYQDSLVWADVVRMASEGRDVALVTSDKVFAGADGQLAPELQSEIDPLRGSVELVCDFSTWLLDRLPWSAKNLVEAVDRSRDDEFFRLFFESDFQSDLMPRPDDLGFSKPPRSLQIIDVSWDGMFSAVTRSSGPGNVGLVQYQVGELVDFVAELPAGSAIENDWKVLNRGFDGSVLIEGSIPMILKVPVLFGDDFGLSIDTIEWRRRDGVGPGQPLDSLEVDPDQLAMFDGRQ